jgi:hypothetical protein
MPISAGMVKLEGFRDELVKLAMGGRLGAAAKRSAEVLAGGKKTDLVTRAEPGALGKLFGSKGKEVTIAGAGARGGALKNLRSADKVLRNEAIKTLAARGTVAAGGTVAVASGAKKHRKTERKQLGRAYVAGARDMYSRSRQRQQRR